jgi:hypothetical protein
MRVGRGPDSAAAASTPVQMLMPTQYPSRWARLPSALLLLIGCCCMWQQ